MEKNMPQKKQLPAFLILGIIALVAAVVLAATNMLTRGPIEEHKMAALKDAFNAVMPADEYEEMTVPGDYNVRSLYAAKKGGETIGYCVTAASMGYASDVAVTLGVGTDGIVTGAAVGDTSFAETAGFGARAKDAAFQEQFAGLDAVNGGSFEALSGATVTSTAVLNATNAAFRCVTEVALGKTPAADPLVTFGAPAEKPKADKPALTGAVQEGKAQGFQSEVTVKLTVEDGVIAGIEVISDGETPGFGTRCGEDEAFQSQFIGKSAPLTLGENIDALSGATVTSTAVVEAANAALAAPASAGGAAATGTAQGFQSEVTVTLTVENGAIASFMVASDGETPGFGTRCGEDEAFQSQFIGKSAPLTLGENIDALSGATVTSTAVVEAANAALASAASAGEEPATIIAEDANAQLGVKADGTAVVTAADGFNGTVDVTLTMKGGKAATGTVTSKKETTAEWDKNGKATATAQGFESKVRATLTLDEAGAIAELKLGTASETEYLGAEVENNADFINQFIGKTAPFTIGENDIVEVSRATVTSKAAVKAINLAAEFAAESEAPVEEVKAEPAKDENAAELDKDGKATATAQGFESKVRATLMLNADGTVAELKLGTASETEYLGAEVENNADFINQFIGKTAPFTLGENDIVEVSRATVTSTAAVKAINAAAAFAAENGVYAAAESAAETAPETETPAEPETEEPAAAAEADMLTATAKGFQSDVTVRLAVKDGVITVIEVTSDGETANFGTRCGEDKAFQEQFLGKSAPLTVGENIDVLSGATVTSKAVIEAVNAALAPAAEEETPAEETAPAAAAANGVVTATAKGFQSDVTVRLAVKDGVITVIEVTSDGETANFGTRCGEDKAFQEQFLGKSAPLTVGENIDVLSGATVTSKAVIEAVNAALAPVAEEETPAEEAAPAAAANGVVTATAKGFQSDVTVRLAVKDGVITVIEVTSDGETANFGTRCGEDKAFQEQFLGKSAPLTVGENIDVLSGATVTSTAVIEAVNAALAQ